jgi:uncharacterized protein (TIGR02646 family)
MIQIVKPAAPAVLLKRGPKAMREMCEAYESAPDDYMSGARTFGEFKRSIYAAKAVQNALRDAQHKKCAFCESLFLHISYGDVEHFRPKAGYCQTQTDELKRPGYYWLAYEWANLFFSCQLCNQRFKKNLFPLKDGRRRARSHMHDLNKEEPLLIDPSKLDPADFIEFRKERAHAVAGCPEGLATIEILGLNRSELVEARGRRLQVIKTLLQLLDLLRDKVATSPTPDWSNRLRDVEKLLRESTEATGEYSAMACYWIDERDRHVADF